MAGSIGNLNIGVTLDGSQAQQGLANLVSVLDQFSAKVARAAAIGSFLGNLTFKAFETSIRGAVNMLETLSSKILQIRLNADKTKFQEKLDAGMDPAELVKSKEFNESVLAGVTRFGMAWDNIIDKVTSIFGPAISGALTGAAAILEVLGKNLSEIFSPENFSLQGMFENMYKITLDIASVLVDAGAKLLGFFNDARLLFNKTVVKDAIDEQRNWFTRTFPKLAKEMGPLSMFYLPDKDLEKNRQKRMKEAEQNGDLAAAQKVIDAGKMIEGFKNRAVQGLAQLANKPPKLEKPPEVILEKAGLKVQTKEFDPMSIFGSSAGYNSDEAYKSRMMLQYRDLFPEEQKNEQVAAVKENTDVVGGKLDILIEKFGGLVPAGVMDFGVA